MNKIKFEIVDNGAPYPYDSWWRIRGANGRIFVASEIMGRRNAKKAIKKIIDAITTESYNIVEVKKK